ncbi:MAG TPA: glycosyltransferase family 39 protein [Vicinamibacterales bacterium]|nr:glycosyltransferase family 39 protein [Vicinamibacterales bacterium]
MDPALLAILLLGIVLRFISISTPLLDAHGWRQIDTAAMARYFYEDSLNPLYPQVNWGGRHGYVESEFPLVPWIAALLYHLLGPEDIWGRVTTVAFSVGLMFAVYLLVLEIRGRAAARAAVLLVAASPGAVYYGRTFMPDTAMLFFAAAALLGFVRYLRTASRSALIWASVSLALAVLVKLPGVLILAPIVAMIAQARGRAGLVDRRLWLAVACAILVAAAWYVHAYFIFRETGLTFGILAHPARTYPAVIAPGPWPDVFSKWSSIPLLTGSEFYRELLHRVVRLHLTPIGLAVALVGLLTWRGPWSALPAGWLAAMAAFILAAGEGNLAHDYYQLPLVVIGAMYFGSAAAPLFDREWICARVSAGWWAPGAVGTLVTALALLMFFESGVIRTHFRRGRLNTEMLQAGEAVQAAVGRSGALLVVVDDYGVTSPVLLHFAKQRGWSFGPNDVSPATVEWLRRVGAGYFVTTDWQDLQRDNRELVEYLSRYRPVQLAGEPAGTRLFDLRSSSE